MVLWICLRPATRAAPTIIYILTRGTDTQCVSIHVDHVASCVMYKSHRLVFPAVHFSAQILPSWIFLSQTAGKVLKRVTARVAIYA